MERSGGISIFIIAEGGTGIWSASVRGAGYSFLMQGRVLHNDFPVHMVSQETTLYHRLGFCLVNYNYIPAVPRKIFPGHILGKNVCLSLYEVAIFR